MIELTLYDAYYLFLHSRIAPVTTHAATVSHHKFIREFIALIVRKDFFIRKSFPLETNGIFFLSLLGIATLGGIRFEQKPHHHHH